MHAESPNTAEPTTDRVLVVLDADDPDTTLDAVVRATDLADAEVHLLSVFPTAEYEQRRDARIDAGVPGPYTLDHLSEEARRVARAVGQAHLGPDGFEAMGAVGGVCGCVRGAVDDHDYSQVYVTDRPRSAWQRLVGGEDLSAELARALPDVVAVVPLSL